VLDNGRPYYRADGSFAGYFGSCIDVTERKEAEAELRRAVREKEALLQELHHRVKNNMQLILSLLRLQGKRMQDPELRRQFEESATRVHSIALVQAQVYQSENLAAIDLGEYLRNLAASLGALYGREGVNVAVEAEPTPVAVQRAVPLGLIANELTANALLHAFPPGRGGRVLVSAGQDGERGRMVVADDGAGMATDLYPNRGGLGFQLVSGLAAQCGAQVSVESGAGGTRWSVSFPAA
jgi:two-component sensor histidine kinase